MEQVELQGDIETTAGGKSTMQSSDKQDPTKQAFNMLAASVPAFDMENMKPAEWIAKRREHLKPWTEFMAFSKFKKPTGIKDATFRLVKNIAHFQSNYMFVFVFLAIYCILTSPLLLLAFMASAGACYITYLKCKEGTMKILNQDIKLGHVYSAIGICSVPLFLIAGAGSAVFWIIGASFFFIGLHAVFYSREDQDDPFNIQMSIV